jgi:hypothetical protein
VSADATIPTWEPSWNPTPNSDGWRLHAIGLDRYDERYERGLADMPTDDDIDAALARAGAARSERTRR